MDNNVDENEHETAFDFGDSPIQISPDGKYLMLPVEDPGMAKDLRWILNKLLFMTHRLRSASQVEAARRKANDPEERARQGAEFERLGSKVYLYIAGKESEGMSRSESFEEAKKQFGMGWQDVDIFFRAGFHAEKKKGMNAMHEYIEKLKVKLGFPSDKVLGHQLGLNAAQVMQLKMSGTVNDILCVRIAELAGDNPQRVLLLSRRSRAKGPARKVWEEIHRRWEKVTAAEAAACGSGAA